MRTIYWLLLVLLGFLLLYFLLFQRGCDTGPRDPAGSLPLNETYCDPRLVDIDFRRGQSADPGVAPQSACATDGLSEPAYLYLQAPRSGRLEIHQYLDRPVTTQLELFVGSRSRGFTSVACEEVQGVIGKLSATVSAGDSLLLRIQPLKWTRPGDDDRPLGTFTYGAFDAQAAAAAPCPDSTYAGRLVLSSPLPESELTDLIDQLGLTVDGRCQCSGDRTLLALGVPPGVDLEVIREKGDAQKPEQDTILFDIDLRLIERLRPLEPQYRQLIFNELEGQFFGAPDPKSTSAADSVVVAIIDSGIDPANPVFTPYHWQPAATAAAPCLSTFGVGGYDFVAEDAQPDDEVGHGTAVASVLLDSWPADVRLRLLHLKFYNGVQGTLFDAICALYGAVEAGATVANLSWGFYADTIPGILREVLDYTREKDVLLVQSAGNDSLNISQQSKWPAAYTLPNMLVVGSYIKSGFAEPARIPFSNYSPALVGIAAPFGAQAYLLGGSPGQDWFSGTSISAPMVTRELARRRGLDPTASAAATIGALLGDPAWVQPSALLDTVIIDRRYLIR